MLLKKYSTIIFCFLLWACNNKDNKIPINTMKKIVWDLQVANEFVLEQKIKDSSINVTKKIDSIFNTIMFTYGYDKKTFLENYKLIEQNPIKLAELLDSTSSYGTKKRDTIVNHIPTPITTPKK